MPLRESRLFACTVTDGCICNQRLVDGIAVCVLRGLVLSLCHSLSLSVSLSRACSRSRCRSLSLSLSLSFFGSLLSSVSSVSVAATRSAVSHVASVTLVASRLLSFESVLSLSRAFSRAVRSRSPSVLRASGVTVQRWKLKEGKRKTCDRWLEQSNFCRRSLTQLHKHTKHKACKERQREQQQREARVGVKQSWQPQRVSIKTCNSSGPLLLQSEQHESQWTLLAQP